VTPDLRARLAALVCVPVREPGRGTADALLAGRETQPWGGYTVFGGDVDTVGAVVAALRAGSPGPLLLASDLERGLAQQVRGGTAFPPPMALGAAADPALAREVGEATGREARALGLNAVFAPVLDLAIEPENPIVGTRAFGDDPAAVAELGAASVQGLQQGGVLATAKHFPGHGRTRQDSHEVLPVVRASGAELRTADLIPFRAAVDAGVGLVMSAHVAYPALEPPHAEPGPATTSRAILTDLLRDEMGFRGAVVSDALIMGAVGGGGVEERADVAAVAGVAARALEAGVDCLLYPPAPPELVEELARRVEAGLLAEEAIDRATDRLAAALARVEPRPAGGDAAAAGDGVPARGAGALALRAAERSLVLVGEPPARGGRTLVLLVLDGGVSRDDVVLPRVAAAPGREFRWCVPEEGPVAPPEDLHRFDDVVLAWFSPIRAWKGRAGPSVEARRVLVRVLEARPSTLISFSSPFILRALPPPRTAILAFGESRESQIAVGGALAGREGPSGRSPVRLWNGRTAPAPERLP
jgi:beta-glucosidase-like glycosyl hydrolase